MNVTGRGVKGRGRREEMDRERGNDGRARERTGAKPYVIYRPPRSWRMTGASSALPEQPRLNFSMCVCTYLYSEKRVWTASFDEAASFDNDVGIREWRRHNIDTRRCRWWLIGRENIDLGLVSYLFSLRYKSSFASISTLHLSWKMQHFAIARNTDKFYRYL